MSRQKLGAMSWQERRSVVWATIERMAFRPDSHNGWLRIFERAIQNLWELEPEYLPGMSRPSFEVPLLNIICEYHIEQVDKYSSCIRLTGEHSRLLFTLHDDPAFVSKASLHHEAGEYPSKDSGYLEDDVQSVLEGMIFHPRNHAHMEEFGLMALEPPLLSPHEVRVSGGIENAFVFLFHLRYQFCLVSEETRHSERSRLVNLFTKAIDERKVKVSAGELFDIRK